MLWPQKRLKIPHIPLLMHHGKYHLCYGYINRKYPHQDLLSFPSIYSCNFPLCIVVLIPQALLHHTYSPFSQCWLPTVLYIISLIIQVFHLCISISGFFPRTQLQVPSSLQAVYFPLISSMLLFSHLCKIQKPPSYGFLYLSLSIPSLWAAESPENLLVPYRQ